MLSLSIPSLNNVGVKPFTETKRSDRRLERGVVQIAAWSLKVVRERGIRAEGERM